MGMTVRRTYHVECTKKINVALDADIQREGEKLYLRMLAVAKIMWHWGYMNEIWVWTICGIIQI